MNQYPQHNTDQQSTVLRLLPAMALAGGLVMPVYAFAQTCSECIQEAQQAAYDYDIACSRDCTSYEECAACSGDANAIYQAMSANCHYPNCC